MLCVNKLSSHVMTKDLIMVQQQMRKMAESSEPGDLIDWNVEKSHPSNSTSSNNSVTSLTLSKLPSSSKSLPTSPSKSSSSSSMSGENTTMRINMTMRTNSSSEDNHICDIYCTECEIATKKSRTLLLSTGGDMVINRFDHRQSQSEQRSQHRLEIENLSENSSVNIPSSNSESSIVNSDKNVNFSVNLNMPSIDFRNHRLVINVNIENKKISNDLNLLDSNLNQLKESGWFFDKLDYQTAQNLLEKTTPGTFLLRKSSDPKFLFSLSVQTIRGPTSVRIHYDHGTFQLDANDKYSEILPRESTVIGLIESVKNSHTAGQVWVEPNGKYYSPVLLTKPLKKNVPTLQHLCRTTVNQLKLQSQVPPGMKTYMAEYPYCI